MSRIFLSHSSVDELEAVALQQWMAANGWEDVFLDIDPQRGLAAGERWQDALKSAADRCEAVVFIVTPAWAKSKWYLAEFLLAKSLNKRIFGAILKPVEIDELPTVLSPAYYPSPKILTSTAMEFARRQRSHETDKSMNEAAWKRLLNLIRDSNVVPVVGPQWLACGDGRESQQWRVAERLLSQYAAEVFRSGLSSRSSTRGFYRLIGQNSAGDPRHD